ncbi:VOC family protein [Bacteriovoracaceae bacterium]|nr:VOC family protein [Bacteriovoracaceae bacterium]
MGNLFLDHIVIGANYTFIKEVFEKLNLVPSPYKVQEKMNTKNYILVLRDNCYVEFLCINDEHKESFLSNMKRPKLLSIMVGTSDINSSLKLFNKFNLAYSEYQLLENKYRDLFHKWKLSKYPIINKNINQTRPHLIEWIDGKHPSLLNPKSSLTIDISINSKAKEELDLYFNQIDNVIVKSSIEEESVNIELKNDSGFKFVLI